MENRMDIGLDATKGQFLTKIMHHSIYRKKPDTIASYYFAEGERILPNRLSITIGEVNSVTRTGRNGGKEVTGQILGDYTKKEESPFKKYPKCRIRTQLWQHPNFPLLEYGTLGISDADGRITRESDRGDLVVIYRNTSSEIQVWVFPSMGNNPDNFDAAMRLVSKTTRGI